MLRNQDRPMIAFVLQSARKKDFASAKEGAAGGQMLRLSKEFESVNKLFLSAFLDISSLKRLRWKELRAAARIENRHSLMRMTSSMISLVSSIVKRASCRSLRCSP